VIKCLPRACTLNPTRQVYTAAHLNDDTACVAPNIMIYERASVCLFLFILLSFLVHCIPHHHCQPAKASQQASQPLRLAIRSRFIFLYVSRSDTRWHHCACSPPHASLICRLVTRRLIVNNVGAYSRASFLRDDDVRQIRLLSSRHCVLRELLALLIWPFAFVVSTVICGLNDGMSRPHHPLTSPLPCITVSLSCDQ